MFIELSSLCNIQFPDPQMMSNWLIIICIFAYAQSDYILKITYLKGWKTEISHVLVHSLNALNNQAILRQEPRTHPRSPT